MMQGRRDNGLYVMEGVLVGTLDKQGGKMRSQQGESIEAAPLEVLEEGRGETQEGTKVRGVRLPQQGQDGSPRDSHDLTHIPFQPWCEVCVTGRAKDDPHQRRPLQPGGSVAMDEWEQVQLDYSFGKTEDSEAEVKMLHIMVLGWALEDAQLWRRKDQRTTMRWHGLCVTLSWRAWVMW